MIIGRPKPKRRLRKFILAVAVVAAIAYGGLRLWQGVGSGLVSSRAEARAANVVEEARLLLDGGKAAEAADVLRPFAESAKDRNQGPQALMLLARAEQAAGQRDLALRHLQQAVESFPDSPEQPKAAIEYARLLEQSGQPDRAVAVYESLRATTPPDVHAPACTGLGRIAEARGDLLQSRTLFAEAVRNSVWDSPEWAEAAEALGRVNVLTIFSPQPYPESVLYDVRPGDNLTVIGNKLNTTQGLLTRANGITESTELDVGQQLKYTPKDFRIVIERSKCRLFLLDKDGIFKVYKAGLGMPGHETTLGSYTIGNKQKDPVWHKPGGGPVPAGDPLNELGTRWMPLVPAREGLPTDLGIHGTIAPETVGHFSSHGCARLLPAEVEELFDLVVRGTPVEIVEEFKPEPSGR